MYLKNLRLDGVRGFRGPRAVSLDFTRPDGGYAGWTVLAGRNAAGKSTLLQAIGLCLMGQAGASLLDGAVEEWLTEGRETGEATAVLVRDRPEDEGPEGDAELVAIVRWQPEDTLFDLEEPEGGPYIEVVFTGSREVQGLLWKSSPRGWFRAGYGPLRRLSGGGTYERAPRPTDRSSSMRTLFREQAALTEAVDWLVSAKMRQMEERSGADELLEAALALLNDELLPGKLRVAQVDSDGPWLRRETDASGEEGEGEPLLPLHRMSDGVRTVFTLVLDIIRQMHAAYGSLELRGTEEGAAPYLPHPGIVLIDEVDAHLHMEWQQRIGQWFKSHFPAVQFIVTTHSPYICQAADEAGLIRLPGLGEEHPPEHVEPDLYREIVYGTGDDATLSELFGLDSPYSPEAEQKRGRLVELEMAIVKGQADDELREEHRTLRDELSSSPVARVDEVAARLLASRERDG
ncbi:AAA family ATPase [Streptomyces cacaoi]|uniref:AAA family ATPase n=1 Tax=Streptomyces cacaoi TaxID=1898 RepID=UPI003748563C